MLLTLKPPLQNGANEHSGSQEPNTSVQRFSFSSTRENTSVAPPPTSAPAASSQAMETSYRNLPPPASMTLPPSEHGVPAASDMAQLPPPPAQWKDDESMRQWLHAKAEVDRLRQEEERRKQEEEKTQQEKERHWYEPDRRRQEEERRKQEEQKTRQEEQKTQQERVKLDQRKVEQSMLRDSLQGGVPPHLVPLIFAGLGGGANLANSALEAAQNHAAQMGLQLQPQQQQQQPQQQPQQQTQTQQQPPPPQQHPPQAQTQPSQPQLQQPQHHQQSQQSQHSTLEVCRDSRMIPPNPYGAQPAMQSNAQGPSASRQMSSPSAQPPFGRGQQLMQSNPTPSSRAPPTPLSRINTADMHVNHPSSASQYASLPHGQQQPQGHPPGKAEPPQAPPQQQQQQTPSSIYFHHWVPPNQNLSQPNTPSAKTQHDSPLSSQPQSSHLRTEYQNSPKKRKAQGAHQPAPPPTSQAQEASPAQSPRRSSPGAGARRGGGHLRHRSDATRNQDARHRDSLESGRVGGQSQLISGRSAPGGPQGNETHGVPDSGSSSDRDQGKGLEIGRDDNRGRGAAPPNHHQPPQTHVFHHHNPHGSIISAGHPSTTNNDSAYNKAPVTTSSASEGPGARTSTSA